MNRYVVVIDEAYVRDAKVVMDPQDDYHLSGWHVPGGLFLGILEAEDSRNAIKEMGTRYNLPDQILVSYKLAI